MKDCWLRPVAHSCRKAASCPRPEKQFRTLSAWLARLGCLAAMNVATATHGEDAASPSAAVPQARIILGEIPATRPSPSTTPPSAGSSAGSGISSAGRPGNEFNAAVLEAIRAMPTGGQYRTTQTAVTALRSSIQAVDSRLVVDAARAMPSFCSGATYLAFVATLNRLHDAGRLPMSPAVLAQLLVRDHQADGAGIWGRWNANGPGTARFFYEAGLGRNFTSFDEAQPGDFMKVFWTDEIGSREFGHSVVYLGRVERPEGEFISFWSSNQPDGFGTKEVPRQRIRRALFSRLEFPDNIRNVLRLPARDPYLAAMLKRPSSVEEMCQMVGTSLPPVTPTPPKQTPAPLARTTSAPTAVEQGKSSAADARKVTPVPPAPVNSATPPPANKPWFKKLFGS